MRRASWPAGSAGAVRIGIADLYRTMPVACVWRITMDIIKSRAVGAGPRKGRPPRHRYLLTTSYLGRSPDLRCSIVIMKEGLS